MKFRQDLRVSTGRVVPCACLLFAVLALSPRNADGAERDGSQSERDARSAQATREPDEEEDEHRLAWVYPRFRLWQYISSAVVSGTNLYLEYKEGYYPDRWWKNGSLFDDAARSWLRADTEEGRSRADLWSDILWHPVQYYTVFVDSLLVPLAFDRGNTLVAWQMTMLNWQAIGAAFFLIRGSHIVFGRARPSNQGCSEEPNAEHPCSKKSSSFMGGHTGMAATGAGLACAHHQALPLYGGGVPEVIPCVVLNVASLTNGVLRVVADKHWATDIVAGYAVGLTIGWGLPWLLHYRLAEGEEDVALVPGLPANTALLPWMQEDTWGAAFVGVF